MNQSDDYRRTTLRLEPTPTIPKTPIPCATVEEPDRFQTQAEKDDVDPVSERQSTGNPRDLALDRYALCLIRRLARRFSRKPSFSRSDEDDIAQELSLHLWQQFHRFDPTRGTRHAFILAILDRHAATLLRRQRALQRNHRGGSIHISVDDGDGGRVELAQLIGRGQLENRTGRWTSTEEQLEELAIDLATVLKELPRKLRQLAEQLCSLSPAEIARKRGVSYRAVTYQLRRLRNYFEQDDFFPTK